MADSALFVDSPRVIAILALVATLPNRMLTPVKEGGARKRILQLRC